MKYVILVLLTLFVWNAAHAEEWGGVVSGSSHKTSGGKYPYFFDDQGHPEVWEETMQKDYDNKMEATLKKLCSDQVFLGELENEYIKADENDNGLNSHPEIGTKIETTKAEITKLSNVVLKGTGQSAKTWGCK